MRKCWPLTALLFLAIASPAFAQYTLTTLATFNSTNGANPNSVSLDASGNLYGTTHNGGANGDGTVFEVVAGSNTATTLATFNGTNGQTPMGNVIVDTNGNVFGTTKLGGINDDGTVFEVAAGSQTVTTLATFNYTNGQQPEAGLLADSSGNFYGTTAAGGTDDSGMVFKVAAGTHALSTLATFNGTNGTSPQAPLIADSSGNMYGTTEAGGTDGDGTVFKIATGTQALSTIASFDFTNGAAPESAVVEDSSSDFYGTTEDGGTGNDGTVFKVASGTHAISTIASFNTSVGIDPIAGLLADAHGDLFGATSLDGPNNHGTLFEIAAGTQAYSTIFSFNGTNGNFPDAALISDSKGNFYGITNSGGANGDGTVFELSPVPEPSSLALLAISSTALLRRKRAQR